MEAVFVALMALVVLLVGGLALGLLHALTKSRD
jgi:hypothetical protein